MTALRERRIERLLLDRCRDHGYLCLKFTSPGRPGVPDRVVITPGGTVFVEVKRPGGRLRRLQKETTAKMRRAGAEVHVVDDERAVDALFDGLTTISHPSRGRQTA